VADGELGKILGDAQAARVRAVRRRSCRVKAPPLACRRSAER